MMTIPQSTSAAASSNETRFEEMKRYVRFTDDHARHLAAFGTYARPHFERIAAEFYDRTREHEDAHRVFADDAQTDRLRATLVVWMERLCSGPHDEAYYLERTKIGRIHVKIGLPQRYMFTGMALIRSALQALASELPAEQAVRTRDALARILDLELAIMLESYHDDYVARLQRLDRIENERLSKQLARSEHRYTSAVELARVLIVGLDAEGRIWLFNREAERLTGIARDEVLGRSFVETLFPEELRQDDGARILRAARGDASEHGTWEGPMLTRSGKTRVVRWQLSYVPNAKDEEVVLFAIGADVTDANALQEKTLRAEKLAAVGTLAAGLAHEIRNPLNGALLHVTFLERALKKMSGSTDALNAASIVGEEIRRLSALVRDFLVFARPGPPQMKKTSLRELCIRAAGLASTDAEASKAKLDLQLPTADTNVLLDAEKIEQVFLNLLRNAIEAVGSVGGGTVTMRIRRSPRHVAVEVEDDGPGLPSADAPIFDAFYSTKPDGTGLGLAIVQRIVSDHGGNVSFESRPGRTLFRVELPIGIDPGEGP
jgi:PAS domain S-box-containing protein